MNIGDGIVSGLITGVSAPFTLNKNSYFTTSASSDIINVVFTPASEEFYSQTINLTGSGGSAQVVLTGTGVPEPFLFLIFSLPFLVFYLRK